MKISELIKELTKGEKSGFAKKFELDQFLKKIHKKNKD